MKSRARRAQLGGFAAYLRWVHRSSRVTFGGSIEGSALVTLWHDAIFCLLAASLRRADVAVYVRAQPGLGDMLAVLAALEVKAIVSDHRGPSGVREAREWLRTPGRVLAVTLDGGAPRRAMPGVVRLARMLRVPLHPLAVSASSGFELRGWDRCVVPHPGARISVNALRPISLHDGLVEGARALERALPGATLVPANHALVKYRRGLEAWPRLCMMPLAVGRLRVGSREIRLGARSD